MKVSRVLEDRVVRSGSPRRKGASEYVRRYEAVATSISWIASVPVLAIQSECPTMVISWMSATSGVSMNETARSASEILRTREPVATNAVPGRLRIGEATNSKAPPTAHGLDTLKAPVA